MIDLHTHVLPGVDDGPADLRQALDLLVALAADGVREVAATPHTGDGRFDVSRVRMQEGVRELAARAADAGIEVRIHPGAEVSADPDLPMRLRRGELTTLGDGGRYLLVETSFQLLPPGLETLFFELMLEGVIPILAHPERIVEVQRHPERVAPLVEAGALLQVNAGSLIGAFGSGACAAALNLIDRRLAHVVASDAHDARRRGPCLGDARVLLRGRVGEEEARAMTEERPRHILAGETVEVPLPTAAAGGVCAGRARSPWWRRVFFT